MLARRSSGRNRHQNWFVESAADDFHLPARDQGTQALEILGMRLLEPFKQRTRVVQTNTNRWMTFQRLDERKISLSVCALKHILEISYRLVRMNEKDKLEFRHRRPQWRLAT